MTVKPLLTSLLSLIMFSSCKQLKSLTAQDNSAYRPHYGKKYNKEMVFLEGISVTPGQNVTSRHTTIGPSVPKSISLYDPEFKPSNPFNPSGDIEKGDWLQVKYSMILNAPPTDLTNTGLLKLIDEWWGTRYSMGGSTKGGIDCSAFSQLIMGNAFGISLPRTAQEQYKLSEKIDDDQLQEGDLVFFHSGHSISHVGIYLRNNKFVHASTSQGVMVSDLNESYWRSKYRCGGRVRG